MSATTTVTAVVNGILPSARDAVDEIAEFDKILKLRDEIFAGTHPRLTVPAHILRKVSPASTLLSSHSSLPASTQQVVQPQLPGLSISHVEQPKPAQAQPATTTSGIDPIFLTKSDDLVKAETHLARQRLEKQLRDQFEQKRLEFRKKPAPAEAKPDFDISALLAKALEIVKPVSIGKEESEKGEEEHESFDENSFYSSKAPDSDPGRADQSSPEEGVQEEVPADLAETATTQAPTGPRRPSSRTDVHPTPASKPIAPRNPFERKQDVLDVDDEDEEGEYSPPEAQLFQSQNGNGNANGHGNNPHAVPDPRSRHMRRYSDLDQNTNGKRHASPSESNMRIVRSHITSPIAPQPFRVSPLALTNEPLVSQGRQYPNGRQRGRADSPSQSPESIPARNKRQKLNRKDQKRARRNIKKEDVSPPPFHDIQPLGQNNRLPQSDERETIIIDEPPTQLPQPPQPQERRYSPMPQQENIRYVPAPQQEEIRYATTPRYIDSPQRPLSRQMEVIPMSEPRIVSRAAMRPRDDQDLRRVVSMHNLRQDQPREFVEHPTPTRQQTPSYMRVDSPMRELPRDYGSDTERPPQNGRVVRTPAPEYREVYQPEPQVRYIAEPMPLPPRERIVVDQYGRRFREIIQERTPVTPRAASSYMPRDPVQYYDNYDSARSGSVIIEDRLPQRYEQDMPPPRIVRQVANQPDESRSATREAYEPLSSARAGSVAVLDRPRQQVIYADSPDDFRTPVRMGSAMPPVGRPQYEDQQMQVMPRAASVRPGREGSVFIDERSSARREYLPMEQPRYRVVDQDTQLQPRYVDAYGREVMPPSQQTNGARYVNYMT